VINSTPRHEWFEKNIEPNYKLETPKITNKRYSILMANNNNKILHNIICDSAIKTDIFINFIKELKTKNENENENEKSYYFG